MKTSAAIVVLACLVASAAAFNAPNFATRAVGRKPAVKKAPAKKAPAKKAPAKKAAKARKPPPASKGYPTLDLNIEFKGISGGGNKAPPVYWTVPDLSDPALQKKRDPKFYAAAAKTRLTKDKTFVFDDGLTELERRQRKTIPAFLTGSAKSQADTSTIRKDLTGEELAFGLSPDRFQLLFISIFGLFTLVGTLSGAVKL